MFPAIGRRATILVCAVSFTAAIVFVVTRGSSAKSPSKPKSPEARSGGIESCRPHFWRKANLRKNDIPDSVHSQMATVDVGSNFTSGQKSKVHYLYADPKQRKDVSVLLLHGQAFSSKTWLKLKTIQYIAAFGYRVVALDLPGHGQSPPSEIRDSSRFLRSVIRELDLRNPVLVSPSMSGSYSLRLLLEYPGGMRGFVPVSPVLTELLDYAPCNRSRPLRGKPPFDEDCREAQSAMGEGAPPPFLDCIRVPTLVVFGEHDMRENSAKLCHLPNSQGAKISNGKHAAYLSDPDLWHKLLYNFLWLINESLQCL